MKRLAAGVLVVAVLVSCAVVFADEPPPATYFGVRFVDRRDDRVRVTSVDPKALAWQMGLRRDDLFVWIGKAGPGSEDALPVRSSREVKEGFDKIGKKDGSTYWIVVERTESGRSVRKTLRGQIRESKKQPGIFYIQNSSR
jgi:hypothetical protein